VQATGGNPDNVAVFAAERTSDGALTVMVLNKYLSGSTPVTLNLSGFSGNGTASVWQLTASNTITALGSISYSDNSLATSVPQQSITLFVFPKSSSPPPPPPVTVNAPSNLVATVLKTGVSLRWTDNSTNESGFYLERRASRQDWVRVATLGAGTTSFVDTIGRGTYDYRVQAFDATAGVTSAWSNQVTVRVK
jgi:hypothetical protein